MQKRQERPVFSVKRILISAAVGLAVTLGLLLLTAVLMERETLPETQARLWALAAAFVGALVAAFLAAVRERLPGAAVTSVLQLVCWLTGGAALCSGTMDLRGLLPLCAVYLAAAAGGTVLAGLKR